MPSSDGRPGAPAQPRPAATVIVARDSDAGPEVLLLRRHRRSGFAPDAWVFPGGVVEAADRALDDARFSGLDATAEAARFGAKSDDVLGFHVAAVRETFEESGLLLACAPVDIAALRAGRKALRDGDAAAFAGWLADAGLVLDLAALTYHSRWVTPTAEPRRYDTCFFLARAPQHQVAGHDAVETTDQRWLTPAAALAAHEAGTLHAIYPTVKTLHALGAHADVTGLLAATAAQGEIRHIRPHIVIGPDGEYERIVHPDEPDYPVSPS